MAVLLNLVIGPSTVNLNSSGVAIVSYAPNAPTVNAETLGRLLLGAGGDDRPYAVSESAVLEISGSSVAAVQSTLRSIESMIALGGPLRQVTSGGSRLFVQLRPDGLATTYRSEIYGGRMEYDPQALTYLRWTQNRTIRVTVGWTRRPFWEDTTERQLPLTNANGTCSTNGLPVYNANDGSGVSPSTRNNYAELAASDVGGVLPAPPRLVLTHNSSSAIARRFYIAHNAQGSPSALTHILEAESASLNSTYCTSASSTIASGGSQVNVVNVPAAGASLFGWNITTGQVGTAVNEWMRFIARFATLPSASTIQLRVRLCDTTSNAVVAQSGYQALTTTDALQVLGTLLFSPQNEGIATYGGLVIRVDGKDSAGTGTFALDFMELGVAAYGSGFRHLKPIDESLVGVPVTGGQLIDNMTEGGLYIESRQRVYVDYGGPLMLQPNTLQRLLFLHDTTSGCAQIGQQLAVQAFYRPRVLSV